VSFASRVLKGGGATLHERIVCIHGQNGEVRFHAGATGIN
jgi:hypothetical protein